MAKFTENAERIEANLKAIENAAKEADSVKAYNPLIEASKQQISNVENEVVPPLNELKPMAWPTETVDKLLQKATDLQEACLQGKNEAEAKASEREFEEVLDWLNKQKDKLEQQLAKLATASSTTELAQLKLQALDPFKEELAKFEREKTPPNEELAKTQHK